MLAFLYTIVKGLKTARRDMCCQMGTSADKIARYQASLKDNNRTNTEIPGAGPDGNPFCRIAWEEVSQAASAEAGHGDSVPSSPETSRVNR
eukprot:scaffold29806_cov16-Tisochrysis_lutea.AAC.1